MFIHVYPYILSECIHIFVAHSRICCVKLFSCYNIDCFLSYVFTLSYFEKVKQNVCFNDTFIIKIYKYVLMLYRLYAIYVLYMCKLGARIRVDIMYHYFFRQKWLRSNGKTIS